MKPPPFEYHLARSVPEAVGLLSQLQNAKVLAGGQSLMAMLNLRYVHPDHLVDINRIPELDRIEVRDGVLRIGAMVRQRRIETSAEVRRSVPILCEALQYVGHRQTRNRGTLGGSLCHLDPSAELPALALLYDATVHIAGPSRSRAIAMADFMDSYMTASIASDELVTAVDFPIWGEVHGHGFCEFARRRGDFAIAAAGCLMERGPDGRIGRIALAVAGVEAVPIRLAAAEAMLHRQAGSEDVFAAAAEQCRSLKAIGDLHGSAEYRKKIAAVMVRRSLASAWERSVEGKGR
jgi:aerobic carbon-monoxide dehydrogenase medium subunit